MKAARIVEFGDPSKLRILDIDRPKLAEGQALIAIRAAGVNPSDVGNLAGKFEQTTLPRIPGRDYAGVVLEGPGDLKGKEVWGTGSEFGYTRDGTHAEFLVVPAASVLEKPRNLSFAQAAIGVPLVAASLAVTALQLKAGETFVVTGSLGSVGRSAIQIARWRGAKTIGIQRGSEKGDADAVIDSQNEDVTRRIQELTSGRGADAALDTVGGPLFDPLLAGLALKGRIAVITAPKDGRVTLNLRDFYHRELTLVGVDSLKTDSVASAEILAALSEGFVSGTLRLPQVQEFPLQKAPEAYALVASGKAAAKIVLVPG